MTSFSSQVFLVCLNLPHPSPISSKASSIRLELTGGLCRRKKGANSATQIWRRVFVQWCFRRLTQTISQDRDDFDGDAWLILVMRMPAGGKCVIKFWMERLVVSFLSVRMVECPLMGIFVWRDFAEKGVCLSCGVELGGCILRVMLLEGWIGMHML